MLGNRALEVTEIVASSGWYDYAAKYEPGGSRHEIPARIPAALRSRLLGYALRAHEALGCRGVSRADFRFDPDREELALLEVNTQPGMTPTSLVPEQAASVGISFPELVEWLVRGRLMPALSPDILRLEQGSLEAAFYLFRRWLRTAAVRGGLGSLALIVCVWAFVEWLSFAQISESIRSVVDQLHQVGIENTQVELGLGEVAGLDRVSREEVERALGLPRTGSVLELSTAEIRNAVESLTWVARAEVRISLPDSVHLHLVEEIPVALWWDGQRWWFVNDAGEGFASADQGAPSFGLPRVIGEGAASAVGEVRSMLSRHSRLFDGQSIFERIGKRRWNVRLPTGILLMLPEREPLQAVDWLRGSGLLEQFSGQDVATIDLRDRNRVPVRFHFQDGENPALARAESNGSL